MTYHGYPQFFVFLLFARSHIACFREVDQSGETASAVRRVLMRGETVVAGGGSGVVASEREGGAAASGVN
jgi:diacylglycerol kinase family enzyme